MKNEGKNASIRREDSQYVERRKAAPLARRASYSASGNTTFYPFFFSLGKFSSKILGFKRTVSM